MHCGQTQQLHGGYNVTISDEMNKNMSQVGFNGFNTPRMLEKNLTKHAKAAIYRLLFRDGLFIGQS